MVIVCGPTGSGKSTSLYAMLSTMDFFMRNVVTVEDPIEYKLADVSQIEVNVKANITFANALRSILRQDPDVICVGEIRDKETAEMALQASHTGHLVLATLHSSSNMAALVRLMDLGIKPMMLASALNVIISQRLVRRLCDNCKVCAQLSDSYITDLRKKQIDYTKIMSPNGCHMCDGTGYRGRTAILDVMVLDDKIKSSLVNSNLSLSDLMNQGNEQSRAVFKRNGLKKVLSGITTFDEVTKITKNLG
jgi:general secretion pathway protein E